MSSSRHWDVRPRVVLATVAVIATAAAGCAGGSSAGVQAVAPTAVPTTSAAASPSRAPAKPGPVVVDERANGSTVRAQPGQSIALVLHSSYWSDLRSTAPAVVRQQGRTLRTPGHCLPGMGCGTFRTSFLAVQPGRTQLLADRMSCGEAMACAPNQRRLSITILVG
jgi:hypothetical protein